MNPQTSPNVPTEAQYIMMPIRERNGLAVAGFLLALIGIFIPTGIVALLGLLMSLVALGRAPRGFAFLGVVTGLFGTIVWLVLMTVAVLGVVAAGGIAAVAVVAGFMFTQPEVIEVTSDMVNVSVAVMEYEDKSGEMPTEMSDLTLSVSTRTDPWGNPYRLIPLDEDPGFDIVSGGIDVQFGTDDDLALSVLPQIWREAWERFGEKAEEFGDRMEQLDRNRGGDHWTMHYDRRARGWKTETRDARPAAHRPPSITEKALVEEKAVVEETSAEAVQDAVAAPEKPERPGW